MTVGTLFIVSTPIGNLEDVSFRALEVLRSVGQILAEDTRHARTLLDRYEIRTPTTPYHQHNEARVTVSAVARLVAGEDLALISDAGTPLVSDPGSRLVRAAIDAGARITPIPGASALLAALVASGLPTDRFTFFGFLPRRGPDRHAAIAAIAALPHVAVLYEAPGRVADTMAELAAAGTGERPAAVAREVTKHFEEFRRGTVGELAAYYADTPVRGEVVIVLGGGTAPRLDTAVLQDRVKALRRAGASARQIVAALIAEDGVPRNAAYRLAHAEPDRSTTAEDDDGC